MCRGMECGTLCDVERGRVWAVGCNVERCAMWNEAVWAATDGAIPGSGGGVKRDVERCGM